MHIHGTALIVREKAKIVIGKKRLPVTAAEIPTPRAAGGLAQSGTQASTRFWTASNRALEVEPLVRVEIDLDHALHALRPDHRWHADIKALHAILACEIRRARQHALFILKIRLGHGDGRSRRRIERRTCLQELSQSRRRHRGPAARSKSDDDTLIPLDLVEAAISR